jgi:hypothetical protein
MPARCGFVSISEHEFDLPWLWTTIYIIAASF